MKALLLALALVAAPGLAQESKKAPPKKPTAQKMPVAKGHSKPTPAQIRRFNELEKKQAK